MSKKRDDDGWEDAAYVADVANGLSGCLAASRIVVAVFFAGVGAATAWAVGSLP
jgi:hypothetical protein